jgi:hypothetical protein
MEPDLCLSGHMDTGRRIDFYMSNIVAFFTPFQIGINHFPDNLFKRNYWRPLQLFQCFNGISAKPDKF